MKYLFFLMSIASLGLFSCSEDEVLVYPEENDKVVEIPEAPGLDVGTELFDVLKGKTATYEIANGGGDYKLIVLDHMIADASIEGNTISVSGKEQGETDVVISDKLGNYQNVKVNVYLSDELLPNVTELNVALPFGKPAEASFEIVKGNGGYTVKSSQEELATAAVSSGNPNQVIVSAKQEGDVDVTVSDSRGLTCVVKIHISKTDSPFTAEQLEAIKADVEVKYMFGVEDYNKLISSNKEYLAGKSFTLDWMDFYKGYGIQVKGKQTSMLVVAFDKEIDYTVGKKEGAKLYIRKNYEYIAKAKDCVFEVIQYKEGKVWATYYHIGDSGELLSGYMIFQE